MDSVHLPVSIKVKKRKSPTAARDLLAILNIPHLNKPKVL